MPLYTRVGDSLEKTYDLQMPVGGVNRRVQQMYVNDAGVWKPVHTFVESLPTRVEASLSTSHVSNAPHTSVTIVGSLVLDSGAGRVPGKTMQLKLGSTVKLTTVTDAEGRFTFEYTPTAVGTQKLVVAFAGSEPHLASSVQLPDLKVTSGTTVTITAPVNGTIGSAYSVPGTVTSDTAQAVTGGTVTLLVNGNARGTASVDSAGAFTLPMSWLSAERGAGQRVAVSYGGSGSFSASTSATTLVRVWQPAPAVPKQSVKNVSNSSLTIRIVDQANITHFTSFCPQTNNTMRVESTGVAGTFRDITWNYSQDTSYTFTLTAHSDNQAGTTRAGNTISVTTGHAAVTDSGSGVFQFGATETGSWRPVDGWSFLGTNLAQGYYTAAYGPYIGVARFDTATLRAQIDARGTARPGRWQHVSCADLEVHAQRLTGSGSGGPVPIIWHMSTGDPGTAGQPSVYFGPKTAEPSGLAPGSLGWMRLPSHARPWANLLLGGTYCSLAMTHNGSSYYSQYKGGTSFAVRMTLSWNWTPIPYKAPTWSQ